MKANVEHARAAHMLLAQGGQRLGRESIADYDRRVRKAQAHALTSIALSLAGNVALIGALPALNFEQKDDDE